MLLLVLALLPLVFGEETYWTGNPINCGTSQYPDAGEPGTPYIVGGWEARVNEFPYQASINWEPSPGVYQTFCGAVFITPDVVMTAAHCVDGEVGIDLRVGLGQHNRATGGNDDNHVILTHFIMHEDYDATGEIENDIALLFLDTTQSFSDAQHPACQPDPGLTHAGDTAVVSGWGADRENGEMTDELRYVTMDVLSDAECAAAFPDGWIMPGMMCATLPGKDSCQGDSGGPLTVKNGNNQFDAVGVVSWGIGCAADTPGVYTRVSYFEQWINDNIGGKQFK